jgi:hypothetical protein
MIAFDFELARTSPKCAVEQTSESVIAQGDGLGCNRSRQEARDRMQAREVAKASIRCSSSGVSTAAFILGSPAAREAQLRFENAATRDGLGFYWPLMAATLLCYVLLTGVKMWLVRRRWI